jgi:hypothetical protein
MLTNPFFKQSQYVFCNESQLLTNNYIAQFELAFQKATEGEALIESTGFCFVSLF